MVKIREPRGSLIFAGKKIILDYLNNFGIICRKKIILFTEGMKNMKNLWGGRFSKSMENYTADYNESISFDNVLYKHSIMGSRAHVKMLAKANYQRPGMPRDFAGPINSRK